MARHKISFLSEFLVDFLLCSLASNTQALGSRILFSSILSIKCASTTYMNLFGKHVKWVHIVDAHFIDKIEEKKNPGSKCLCSNRGQSMSALSVNNLKFADCFYVNQKYIELLMGHLLK